VDKKISQHLTNYCGNLPTNAKIMALIIFMTKIIHGEVILPQLWTYLKLRINWSFISWATQTRTL